MDCLTLAFVVTKLTRHFKILLKGKVRHCPSGMSNDIKANVTIQVINSISSVGSHIVFVENVDGTGFTKHGITVHSSCVSVHGKIVTSCVEVNACSDIHGYD